MFTKLIDFFDKYSSVKWKGKGELWLDLGGNSVTHYECDLIVQNNALAYSWLYKNDIKHGRFTLNDGQCLWMDEWHQVNTVHCYPILDSWGVLAVRHEYEVDDAPNWAWRTILSVRPDGALVLQMTNIAPWGEEGRAVRMVFYRENSSPA